MSEQSGNVTEQQAKFELQKVYLKDVSLETPNSPEVFSEQWKPQFELELNTTSKPLSDEVYEVVLTVTVTAKLGEKIAYLAELQQGGVFTLKDFPKERMGAMLGAFCPNTLFPYAREAVDTLLVKGGFPPLHLSPVNFDALYTQHVQAQREKKAAASTTH